MLIWTLDVATKTGFAFGEAGTPPKSGTVRLRRKEEPREVAPFNLLAFLRDRFVFGVPELVVIESFLNPAGQRSADAVILQILCHGAAQALLRSYGVRVETVAPATWRKHFLGTANAGDRDATKQMTIRRGRQLGYLPADCSDDNRADAVGIYDYASTVLARRPISLVLHGANA